MSALPIPPLVLASASPRRLDLLRQVDAPLAGTVLNSLSPDDTFGGEPYRYETTSTGRARNKGTVEQENGNGKSDECSRKTCWIDLNRIRLSVDPRLEWRQMLREVWRLQRDQFWVADMSGIDWEAAYRRY